MNATTVLRSVGLVLCLTALVPATVFSTQPLNQGASSGQDPSHLTQPEVLILAKTAARKVVRQKIYDYDVMSVIFDASAREWSVLFDQKPPRTASRSCLYVYVKDETRDATVKPC